MDLTPEIAEKIGRAKKLLHIGDDVEVHLNFSPESSQPQSVTIFHTNPTPTEGWKKMVSGSYSTTVAF